MKLITCLRLLLSTAVVALWTSGCATGDVNPHQPRANTGYVDLRADTSDLSWDVEQFDAAAQKYSTLFSELEPPPGGVLRLAMTPGRHRLQVSFLNRVIGEPAEFDVEVADGKVTAVLISLTDAGSALVESKSKDLGQTSRYAYGRRTNIKSTETTSYNLSAKVGSPIPYRVKEEMPAL